MWLANRHIRFAVRGFICLNLEVEKATFGVTGGIGVGVGVIALRAATQVGAPLSQRDGVDGFSNLQRGKATVTQQRWDVVKEVRDKRRYL